MELEKAIRERRSIRAYRSDPVPRQVLERVIETALWAPSGMNRQEWDLYVVEGERKDALVEIVARSESYILPHLEALFSRKIIKISLQVFRNLGGAPVVILVTIPRDATPISFPEDPRARYHEEFNRYNRLLSAASLIQNLLLAAHAQGLGTCWMTGPKYMEEEILSFLGIEDRELVSIIPVGYPDQAPPPPPRKQGVVHWL